jgi:hypothetical protein
MKFSEITKNSKDVYDLKVFERDGESYKVKMYYPTPDEKQELYELVLQETLQINGVYNSEYLKDLLKLFYLMMCSDIEFETEEKGSVNRSESMNTARHLFSLIEEKYHDEDMSAKEIDDLTYFHYVYFREIEKPLVELSEIIIAKENTMVGFLEKLVADLPKQADALKEILDSFDEEKYKEVMNLYKSVKGGQPLDEAQ